MAVTKRLTAPLGEGDGFSELVGPHPRAAEERYARDVRRVASRGLSWKERQPPTTKGAASAAAAMVRAVLGLVVGERRS